MATALLNPSVASVAACNAPAGQRHVRQRVQRRIWQASSSSEVLDSVQVSAAPPSLEKQKWQSSVKFLQARQKHRLWEPVLSEPAPLLGDVCVVLVSPKRPISVGTVARSCSCFEVQDLRIVEPRCNHLARSSRNGSKGAQYLLWRAQEHESLAAALADADFSVACTRWVAGRPNAYRSVAELLQAPLIASLLGSSPPEQPAAAAAATVGGGTLGLGSSGGDSNAAQDALRQRHHGGPRKRLALVFGREVEGFAAEELDMCDATLSIPIGRLQESMSLSHAVSVVLSRLFEQRQALGSYAAPEGVQDLAAGFQDSGVER